MFRVWRAVGMSLRGDVVVGWPTALKSGVEFRVWDFGFGVYCLRYRVALQLSPECVCF